jgi:hypothetical protein
MPAIRRFSSVVVVAGLARNISSFSVATDGVSRSPFSLEVQYSAGFREAVSS